jgi:hypothetical protein
MNKKINQNTLCDGAVGKGSSGAINLSYKLIKAIFYVNYMYGEQTCRTEEETLTHNTISITMALKFRCISVPQHLHTLLQVFSK